MIVFKQMRLMMSMVLLFAISIFAQASNIIVQKDTTIVEDAGEFVKNYNKTFTVNQNDMVILSNRYGKINVKPSSGSQVVINVSIRVRAESQSDADKVFDRINIIFANGPEFVKAETEIEQKSSWSNWTFGNNRSDYTIDYDVSMPTYNRLDLANRYGNSYIGAMGSFVKIDQKYGDFKLESASTTQISLAYGGGSISKTSLLEGTVSYGKLSTPDIKDVKLKSKYSEFKFDNITNLDIQSAYDDYDINDVKTLKVDSKYGDFIIGTVNDINVISSYTDYRIRKVVNSADFQATYGDVKINDIQDGFNTINIKGSYTDFYLNMAPSVSYQLDVTSSYSDISRPASLNFKIDKERGSTKEILGYVGNANTKSLLRARLNYGDLIIK
jgi:hypothetical protein